MVWSLVGNHHADGDFIFKNCKSFALNIGNMGLSRRNVMNCHYSPRDVRTRTGTWESLRWN